MVRHKKLLKAPKCLISLNPIFYKTLDPRGIKFALLRTYQGFKIKYENGQKWNIGVETQINAVIFFEEFDESFTPF